MDLSFHHHVTVSVDECLAMLLGRAVNSLESLAADVKLIRKKEAGIQPDEATGINVSLSKESIMATKASCTLVKASHSMKAAAKASVTTKLATGVFQLLDGGSGSFTTLGVDSATPPNQVDISGVATETVVSDDPNLVVGAVTGMTVVLTAPPTGAATANVTFTATWNDGSVGPFSFVAAVSYSGGAITGITVIQNP